MSGSETFTEKKETKMAEKKIFPTRLILIKTLIKTLNVSDCRFVVINLKETLSRNKKGQMQKTSILL